MTSIAISTLTAGVNMPDPEYESVGELVAANTRLKDEALGWHAKAARLEEEKKELEIEIAALKDQIKKLAIENVKLLNKSPKNKARQYADFSCETLQNHDGIGDVSAHQPLHSAAG